MAIRRNKNVVLRNIHDTYFLIDITDNYQDDKCVLYEINEIGKFIWENIDGKNVDDVARKLHSIPCRKSTIKIGIKKGGLIMSRCPKLDYESRTIFSNYDDKYICTVTGEKMDVDDSYVSRVCKGSCDAYYDCPIYKKL